MEFDSKKELQQYLKEHPKADASKHRVRGIPRKPSSKDDAEKHIGYIASNYEVEPEKIRRILKKDTKHIADKAERLSAKNDETLKELKKDPELHARAKKELTRSGDRSDKNMQKLEDALAKASGDPKKARAIRDYVEALANEGYLEDEKKAMRARRNKARPPSSNEKG